jgi:ribosomal protein L11 methyltransferase
VSPEKTILDIGCGSGILSIAALLLGAKNATAVDIDPLAVKTARENAEINDIDAGRYTVLEGNLADKVSGTFDIIVTNIVADVIILFCENVSKFMKPDSVFITSGIIDMRENDVLSAFERYGFVVKNRHEKNGWVCFECYLKKTNKKESPETRKDKY